MTEDERRKLISKDIERQIVAKHKQWVRDMLDLCDMAEIPHSEGHAMVLAELTMRAAQALAMLSGPPERYAEMIRAHIVDIRRKQVKENSDA